MTINAGLVWYKTNHDVYLWWYILGRSISSYLGETWNHMVLPYCYLTNASRNIIQIRCKQDHLRWSTNMATSSNKTGGDHTHLGVNFSSHVGDLHENDCSSRNPCCLSSGKLRVWPWNSIHSEWKLIFQARSHARVYVCRSMSVHANLQQ